MNPKGHFFSTVIYLSFEGVRPRFLRASLFGRRASLFTWCFPICKRYPSMSTQESVLVPDILKVLYRKYITLVYTQRVYTHTNTDFVTMSLRSRGGQNEILRQTGNQVYNYYIALFHPRSITHLLKIWGS